MAIEPINSDKLDSSFSNINGYYGDGQMMNWFAPPTNIENVGGVDYEFTPYGVPMDEPFWVKERKRRMFEVKSRQNDINIVPTRLPSGDRLEDWFSSFSAEELSTFVTQSEEKFSNLVCDDLMGFDQQYSNSFGDWLKKTSKNVGKSFKDAGKSISDAGKNIKQKGVGGALKDLKKETQKLTKDAAKNIKGTIADAKKSVKDAYESAKKWVGDNLGGGVAIHYLNRVSPIFITMRGSVIGLIELNVVGIATAMGVVKDKSKKHYDEVLQKWWIWGGDKKRYDEAIETGRNKKKLFLDLVQKARGIKGVDGMYYISANGEEFSYAEGEENVNPAKMVAVATAALGATSGVLATIPSPDPLTKSVAVWTGVGSAALGAMGGIMKSFAKEQGATEEEVNAIPQGDDLKNAEVPTTEKELIALREQVELAKQGKEPSLEGVVTNDVSDNSEVTQRLDMSGANDKILGMPKNVFYIVLGVVVVGGGLFAYKLLKGKK